MIYLWIMSLRQMQYFAVLAEELHFGKASARLHIAQPALSQQIRNLEEQLDVKLLDRTSRKVVLTPAGELYNERVRAILKDIGQAENDVRQLFRGICGVVRAGYLTSAMNTFLPDAVKVFRDVHPRITLRLSNMCSYDQFEALAANELDVAFANPQGLRNKDFLISGFVNEEHMLAVPQGHPLALLDEVPLEKLDGVPMVTYHQRSSCKTVGNFNLFFEKAGVRPCVVQEAPQEQTILSLVAGGVGVAMVPSSCAAQNKAGIVYVPFAENAPKFQIAMVRRNEPPAPSLDKFIATMESLNPSRCKQPAGQSGTATAAAE
ncbi:MAG: LysR substrate-binding domain-containing protein [Desulfovibrio sp.]|uniref:LysR substrate-binding domain-containing protein n=1 Tax=Desulfovibrio sp. 7SRBS1 TaxID=3378064 RepID=UPI003B41AB84